FFLREHWGPEEGVASAIASVLSHRLGVAAAIGCHWHPLRDLSQRNEVHATDHELDQQRAANSSASPGRSSLEVLNVKRMPVLGPLWAATTCFCKGARVSSNVLTAPSPRAPKAGAASTTYGKAPAGPLMPFVERGDG